MENPEVLLLDEPFNGLENDSVIKIINLLKDYAKEGKLILISTHIKEDLEKLSDVILFFDDGKINEK